MEKVIKAIVDDLFVNGDGVSAERLVLTDSNGGDLGGWHKRAVVNCIREHLAAPNEKPPLGLRPKLIAEQLRLAEILAAMGRYARAEVEIPGEWFDELRALTGPERKAVL